jgi:cytoskeletal protein CcmA (bactofilin family)
MWSHRTVEPAPGDSPGANAAPSTNEPERVTEAAGRVTNVAVIGKGMTIKGEIRSKESLHVDGEVEGTLYMSGCRLTVSRGGKLGANVTAREIELMGVAQGDLEATGKITIRKGARLVGDLRAPGIVIEEGAYVKGKIEIVNADETAQDAPAAQLNTRKAAAG